MAEIHMEDNGDSALVRKLAEQMKILDITANACRILAEDESESAYNKVTDLLALAFSAETVVFFFMNGLGRRSAVVSGSKSILTLGRNEWSSRVKLFEISRTSHGIGPWAHSGTGGGLPYWLGASVIASGEILGWFMAGRSSRDWSDYDERGLIDVADAISSVVAARNIREREEHKRQEAEKRLSYSEWRLRTFLEESRDMIYTADGNDVILEINAAGLALLGNYQKNEVVGRNFSQFVVNPAVRDFLHQRIRENGYADDYEILLKRKDGETVFCVESCHAFLDSNGAITELRGIVNDISERIKNERELWRSNMELAQANLKLQQTQMLLVHHEKLASIGQLAAGIAHEINNPLGFLKSNHATLVHYISKIRAAWDDVRAAGIPDIAEIEKRRDIEYIFSELASVFRESEEGYNRIISIVSNLKSFARQDKGVDFDLFDINAGIESTLVVVWNEIKYVADIRKNLNSVPQIRARGNEINQVILNILMNAAQAIGEQKRSEKGTITISTYENDGIVTCIIEDDGPGIPEEIQLKIFDPFFTTKAPGKGTGLGLSISYDIIVTKHGGALRVESKPGQGTKFFIELPVNR